MIQLYYVYMKNNGERSESSGRIPMMYRRIEAFVQEGVFIYLLIDLFSRNVFI